MEKIIYILMPMALLFKLFVTKKETGFEMFIRYFALCFINNFFSVLAMTLYFPKTVKFEDKLEFTIKYCIIAFVIGIIMAIIYRLFVNFIQVKFEVVHEKGKEK